MTEQEMEKRLQEAYPDAQVAVLDATGAGSYFEVRIASSALNELPLIKRHRAVMDLFKTELDSGEIHALTLKTVTL